VRVRVVRRFDLPPEAEVLVRLASQRHSFLRMAAGGPSDLARWSFAGADPVETFVVRSVRGPTDRVFARLARRWPAREATALRTIGPRLPFAGGWFGAFGYELRSAVEAIPPPRPPPDGFPALWLGRYDAVLAWDRATGRSYVAATAPTAARARAAADRLLAKALPPAPGPGGEPHSLRVAPFHARGTGDVSANRGGAWIDHGVRGAWPQGGVPPVEAPRAGGRRAEVPQAEVPPAAYRRRVAEARERILAGDVFQANVSQRFTTDVDAHPLDLFARLVATSPVPFLTWLDLGGGRRILSASPERFLALHGRRAETRPMKGTRPRASDPARDRRLRRDLETSAKDRAELAMIVDLSRNDLGRVCDVGTVRVEVPRRLERYATVHQAVAIVAGRLRRDASGLDLLRAAFPPGSVTGAPKVESMRVIDDLEGEPRGPYCGAIGWIDESGDLDLAVAIRTLCTVGPKRGAGPLRVTYRVGGGVTVLSDPEAERVETLDKGRALAAALAGAPGRR
jgi:para-aminobenzoate synthetase component 1